MKDFLKKILKVKTQNCIKCFFNRLMNNLSTQTVTNRPNSITQSEAPAPEEIVVGKFLTDISVFPEQWEKKVQV